VTEDATEAGRSAGGALKSAFVELQGEGEFTMAAVKLNNDRATRPSLSFRKPPRRPRTRGDGLRVRGEQDPVHREEASPAAPLRSAAQHWSALDKGGRRICSFSPQELWLSHSSSVQHPWKTRYLQPHLLEALLRAHNNPFCSNAFEYTDATDV